MFRFTEALSVSPWQSSAILKIGTFLMNYSFFVVVVVNKSKKQKVKQIIYLLLQSPKSANTLPSSHRTIGVIKWPVSYSADLHNNISRPFGLIGLVYVTFRLHWH